MANKYELAEGGEKACKIRDNKLEKYYNMDFGKESMEHEFDGDADRCLCVDEKGEVITGDHILYIYGCYMKDRDKLVGNKVVTTVMSNFGLYKAFDAVGIEYEKTKVGDKYVYECMSENGYDAGVS